LSNITTSLEQSSHSPFFSPPKKNSRLKKAATLCRDLDARLVVVAS
jgi:hypothetical protein